jgi:hypothetical protein
MARLVALVLCSCLVSGAMFPAGAQGQQQESPAMRALVAKNEEFAKLYRAKNYPGALKALDEMIALAQQADIKEAVAGALYNKACIYSITGRPDAATAAAREAVTAGYTSYMQFASDTDFDPIRRNPGFIAFMKEVRDKYGPKPLEWDPTRTVASFPITFDGSAHPALLAMRREFDIDKVVASAGGDEYARLRAVTAWASAQWPHSPTEMASKADPVTILREARAGGRFICRDYAIVVAGVAMAYGLPARLVNLLPRDVETRSEAHAVAEVWLNRFNKWALADGQYGTVAEIAGVPLNAIELQAALARDDQRVRCAVGAERCAEWKTFIISNMFYFKFAQDQRRFESAGGAQLVLVPKGAADPHKFAGGNETIFSGAVYISDPAIFYARPR